jgi:hypothetical protein
MSGLSVATSRDLALETYAPRELSTTLVEPVRRAVEALAGYLRPITDLTGLRVAGRDETEAIVPSTTLQLEHPAARWQAHVEARLVDLYADPYGDVSLVARAGAVAQSLFEPSTPTPSVGWSEDGGITYSWHRNGWHCEIEVTAADTLYWALRRGAPIETVRHGSVNADRLSVQELLVALGDA